MNVKVLYTDDNYNQVEWHKLSDTELKEKNYMWHESKVPYLAGYDNKIESSINRTIENIKMSAELNNQRIINMYRVENANGITGEIVVRAIIVKK